MDIDEPQVPQSALLHNKSHSADAIDFVASNSDNDVVQNKTNNAYNLLSIHSKHKPFYSDNEIINNNSNNDYTSDDHLPALSMMDATRPSTNIDDDNNDNDDAKMDKISTTKVLGPPNPPSYFKRAYSADNLDKLTPDELKEKLRRSIIRKSKMKRNLKHQRQMSYKYQQTITTAADQYEDLLNERMESLRNEYELKEHHEKLRHQMQINQLNQQVNDLRNRLQMVATTTAVSANSSPNSTDHKRTDTPLSMLNRKLSKTSVTSAVSVLSTPGGSVVGSQAPNTFQPFVVLAPTVQVDESDDDDDYVDEDEKAKLMRAMSPQITSVSFVDNFKKFNKQNDFDENDKNNKDKNGKNDKVKNGKHNQQRSRDTEEDYSNSDDTDVMIVYSSGTPTPSPTPSGPKYNNNSKKKKKKKKRTKKKKEPSLWDIVIKCITPSVCEQ